MSLEAEREQVQEKSQFDLTKGAALGKGGKLRAIYEIQVICFSE